MMNWKGYGRKQSWPNLRYGTTQQFPGGTEENHKKPSVRIASLQAEI
jgi:hypothetical protein